ncbi:MAG: EamA family transporter RarD [Thermohalobaculum sp.]|nr:EamA family transporter RarD [Thermohalobaculum sp.]
MAGLWAAIAAATIWGVAPLFFAMLRHVPAEELLAHRTIWAAVFVGGFCLLTGRTGRIAAALGDARERRVLAMSACLIGANWFIFLLAIQAGRVTECGIGYYIMPLMGVVLGVAVLGERLDRAQWAAVGLAVLAVVVLSAGTGSAPWLPLSLALSFSLYGLLRKRAATGAISGFVVETMLLAPLALVWVWGAGAFGWTGFSGGTGGHFGADLRTSLLLVAAGPVTGVPLILFAEAARRLAYSTTGLVLYIGPTLQVLLASLVLGEHLTGWHYGALPMIWLALGLYSTSALLRDRASRRAATALSTVSTTIR